MTSADSPQALAPWSTRSRREVYRNPWIRLEEHVAVLPNGHETLYGVVRCQECVGVLPFPSADEVLLVGQWRYIQGRASWEMPTGAMHPGEEAERAAQRELAEEAGVRAGRLVPVTAFWTSKSVVEETAHLFLALDLSPAEAEPDPTELIARRTVPFDEALDLVLRGEIVDAMTIIALLWADRLRGLGELPAP
ncbi:MAG: NUDIX domain-containing protein [Acidimicrobiia bacterium]|nr:NUDIX domain-containing protein [Acidimicrobiia bacterium]